ncbi:MAG: radical SAM family heme chaperone HemW [Bdellovibrionales bacterium]
MSFGVYVHIPYCLQRCVYCDFATFEVERIGHSDAALRVDPPEQYVKLVCQEIRQRSEEISTRKIDTLYFGGGTPSLIEPHLILAIIQELRNSGFELCPDAEATIEINPATITEAKLDQYLKMGLNRFSVGVQSFTEAHLQKMGRKHSAQDSRETLTLLSKYKTNFNSDLLFALPHQTSEELKRDIGEMLSFGPSHISPYCLTVPDKNPMAHSRPSEEHQVKMFEIIHEELTKADFFRYEISNYALPGKESRHNLLYWKDEPYWGLGLSSHSYLRPACLKGLKTRRDRGERGGLLPVGRTSDPTEQRSIQSFEASWGVRFWNPPTFEAYKNQILHPDLKSEFLGMPSHQFEFLELHQAITDYCHTALRMSDGLSQKNLKNKFSSETVGSISDRLNQIDSRLLTKEERGWKLTEEGLVLSNLVFEKITFLKEDLPSGVLF